MSESEAPRTCCIYTWRSLEACIRPSRPQESAVEIALMTGAMCRYELLDAVMEGLRYIHAAVAEESTAVSVGKYPESPDDVRLAEDREDAAEGIGAFASLAVARMFGLHGLPGPGSLERQLQLALDGVARRDPDPLEDAGEDGPCEPGPGDTRHRTTNQRHTTRRT